MLRTPLNSLLREALHKYPYNITYLKQSTLPTLCLQAYKILLYTVFKASNPSSDDKFIRKFKFIRMGLVSIWSKIWGTKISLLLMDFNKAAKGKLFIYRLAALVVFQIGTSDAPYNLTDASLFSYTVPPSLVLKSWRTQNKLKWLSAEKQSITMKNKQ